MMTKSPLPPGLPSQTRWTLTIYTLAALATTWLLAVLLFSGDVYQTSLTLALVLIVAVAIWRGGGLVILASVQIYLMLREPPQVLATSVTLTGLVAFLVIILLALVYRLKTLLESHQMTSISSWIRQVRAQPTVAADQPAATATQTEFSTSLAWQMLGTAAGVTLSILVGLLVFSYVPRDNQALRDVGLQPTGLRVIQIAFVITATYFIVQFFVEQWTWRRMGPPQAQIFLRSSLVGWLMRDFRGISRGTMRAHRRQAKRARKTTARKTKSE